MKYKINLITKKETPLVEKLVYFALNYLRYIIVLTQLVVIGVFFFRFQVDQRIIDLKEAVEQKKEIVQIVLPLLNEASRIDKKTTQIETILNQQSSFESMAKYFLSIFPESMQLNNMEMLSDSMKVSGTASNPAHLQAFFQLMKQDKKFGDVTFQTIKKGDNGYDFVLNLSKWTN